MKTTKPIVSCVHEEALMKLGPFQITLSKTPARDTPRANAGAAAKVVDMQRAAQGTGDSVQRAGSTAASRSPALAGLTPEQHAQLHRVVTGQDISQIRALVEAGAPVFEWVHANMHTWNQGNLGSLMYYRIIEPLKYEWWGYLRAQSHIRRWLDITDAAPAVRDSIKHQNWCDRHQRREEVTYTAAGVSAVGAGAWVGFATMGPLGLVVGPVVTAAGLLGLAMLAPLVMGGRGVG